MFSPLYLTKNETYAKMKIRSDQPPKKYLFPGKAGVVGDDVRVRLLQDVLDQRVEILRGALQPLLQELEQSLAFVLPGQENGPKLCALVSSH